MEEEKCRAGEWGWTMKGMNKGGILGKLKGPASRDGVGVGGV